MKKIKRYAFSWNTEKTEGLLQLLLEDDGAGTLPVNSASEGLLLLDLLRNEKPVYFNEENNIIMSRLEAVGEGED